MRTAVQIFILLLVSNVLPAQLSIHLSLISNTFGRITDIKNAGDNRLFVVDQAGYIRILNQNSTVNQTPFLDIHTIVNNSGEQGLLGLAFHPQYGQNGYFYVNYVTPDQNTIIARYQVSAGDTSLANPLSETLLLSFSQPYTNHNGGELNFGPDGYLYISSGDGGSGGDPLDKGQDSTSFLGKMLRIDVDNNDPGLNYAIPPTNPLADGPGGNKDEIWSTGLRNPWRFSFDRLTGDLWIGDVGQGLYEEIDLELAGSAGGLNFGWRCYEGNHNYNSTNCASMSAYTFPVYEYAHSLGCSITGGYVYRGQDYPLIYGRYLYTDYCSGKIWSLRNDSGNWINELLFENSGGNYTSFGENSVGEMYIGNVRGELFKIGACDPSVASNYSNLNISDDPIPAGTYQAGNSLISTGRVENASHVNFYSFGSIQLDPGFRTENEAVFNAQASPCPNAGN